MKITHVFFLFYLSLLIFCFVGFSRTIQDPATQRLTWYKPPLTVLVIKKVRDASVLSPFVQLVQWLIEVKKNKYIVLLLLCDVIVTRRNK